MNLVQLSSDLRSLPPPFNSSAAQLHILAQLSTETDPVTPRYLATTLGLPKPSVTRALQALEAEHMIKRSNDPEDARSVLLALNAQGRRLVAKLEKPATVRSIKPPKTKLDENPKAVASL